MGLGDRLRSSQRVNSGVNSLAGLPACDLETRPNCFSQLRVRGIILPTDVVIASRCQALCYRYIAIAHDDMPLVCYPWSKHIPLGSLANIALIYGDSTWSLVFGSNTPCSRVHLELESSNHHQQDGKRSPYAALSQIDNLNIHCLQGLGVMLRTNGYLIFYNRWLSNKVSSIIFYNLSVQSSQRIDTLILSHIPLATSPYSEYQRSPPDSPFGEQRKYIGQSLPRTRD